MNTCYYCFYQYIDENNKYCVLELKPENGECDAFLFDNGDLNENG